MGRQEKHLSQHLILKGYEIPCHDAVLEGSTSLLDSKHIVLFPGGDEIGVTIGTKDVEGSRGFELRHLGFIEMGH